MTLRKRFVASFLLAALVISNGSFSDIRQVKASTTEETIYTLYANGGSFSKTEGTGAYDILVAGASTFTKTKVTYTENAIESREIPLLQQGSTNSFWSREGYTFVGWYSAAVGGVEVTEVSSEYTDLYAHWTPNSYKVTYDANGGTLPSSVTTSKTVTYDSCYGTLPELTRVNYLFDGWYTAATGGTKITSSVPVFTASDHTLYAHWNTIDYIIKFDANGGSGSMTSVPGHSGSTLTLPENKFSKVGYDFKGWSLSAGNSAAEYSDKGVIPSGFTTTSGNTYTLYAVWEAKTCIVNYLPNGGTGTISPQSVKYNSNWSIINNSFKAPTGMHFSSWNTKADGSGTMYTAGMSTLLKEIPDGENAVFLYAIWVPNEGTISFDANGGTGSMGLQSAKYGVGDTIITNEFTREGYDFVGWSTDKTAKEATLLNRASVDSLLKSDEIKITLYAIWAPKTYTITLNTDGGKCPNKSVSVVFGEKYDNLPDASKTGYVFKGWYCDDVLVKSTDTVIAADREFVAVWEPIKYTIVYQANGGTGTMDDSSRVYDDKKALLSNEFNKIGYTFIGWSTSSKGEVVFEDCSVENITSESGATVKLYAIWQANKYTVVYHSNTDKNTTFSQEMEYDAENELASTGFSLDYHNLVSWNTKADGSGISYSLGAEVSNLAAEGQFNLFAQWTETVYNINYELDGGEVENPSEYTYSSKFSLAEPKKAGYEFTGWINTANGTLQKQVVIEKSSGDLEFKAVWKAISYSIVYDLDDGSFNKEAVNSYTIESETLMLDTPAKRGYTFAGWTSAKVTEPTMSMEIVKGSIGDLKFTAHWTPNTYNVEYETNGGSFTSDTICKYTFGTGLTLPTCIEREDYYFVGWKKSLDGEIITAIDKDEIGNLTFYAEWEYSPVSSCKISYFDSETELTESQFKEYDSFTLVRGSNRTPGKLTLPTANDILVEKNGYTFAGWYTSATCTGSAIEVCEYSGEYDSENKPVSGEGFKKYFAKWDLVNYSIDYDLSGGKANNPISYDVEMSSDIVLKAPEREGYTFKGWITNDTEEPVLEVIIAKGSLGNLTYKAVWEANKYDVDLNLGEGELLDPSEDVNDYTYGEVLKLPTEVVRESYKFEGWYTTEDCSGEPVTEIAADSIGSVQLYAKWLWSPVSVISFVFNDGDLVINNTIANYASYYAKILGSIGDPITIKLPTSAEMIKEGYEFIGWYDNEDLIGNAITEITYTGEVDEENRPIAANAVKTLYAKWTVKKVSNVTNTDVSNGGTGKSNSDVTSSPTKNTKVTNFTISGIKYKVISGKTISVAGVSNKKTKKVTVPKTVKYNSVKYTIVKIDANAFKNCTKLKSVNCKAAITEIGKKAFAGCKKLKTLKLVSKKLKKVGKSSLQKVKKCTVDVPNQCKKKYKKLFKQSKAKKLVIK